MATTHGKGGLAKSALAIFFLCLTASPGRTQSTQEIVSALRSHQYTQALDLAEKAIKSNPRSAQILTLEALALKGLGREPEALTAFRHALQIDPDYLAALEGAAQIEYATANPAAIPLLDRLLKLRPDDATANAMRAVMAWNQHDCATALRHFERSQSLLPSQPDALREYGICLVKANRLEPAAQAFQQLVSADPANRAARRSLAAVQMMEEHWQAALESLQPLLAGDPDSEALAIASAAYEALGETPQAVAALRQAIVLSPRNVRLYVDFANLSFAHQSWDAGIQMLNAGLKLTPDSAELHLARGILYVQMGQAEKADADFAVAERLDPRQRGTADARVLEYLQQNNLDAAVALVREQIKARPGDAFLYYLLAESINWQGPPPASPQFRQALEAARKAVQLQPSLTLARNLLSRLYLDSGQVKTAIEECRAILRTDPHDPVALYRLMRALKASGDPKDAQEIPDVVRRFNEARELENKREAQENRYRLVEAAPGAAK